MVVGLSPRRIRNARTVERGALGYGLKIKERWAKGNSKTQGDYWSVYPETDWNYALQERVVENPTPHIKVVCCKIVDSLFVWN